MARGWIQTGGQDPNMEVDVLSFSWWWEQRDRRTDQYTILMYPLATILASLSYVLIVTWLGPWFMRNRKPYSLQTTMLIYNLSQVIISVYIVVEGWNAGWGRHYSWTCQNVESGTETGSTAMRMAAVAYVYLINKYIEFADTFFFVARKKTNQITFLHVYHHAIMPVFAFVQCRWLPGGHEMLIGLINSFVHVFMYSYYLLSALGPKIQPYLWWKKYLTLLQLVQFSIAMVRTLMVITGVVECGYPWINSLGTFIFIYVPFFSLFLDFYLKSYSSRTPKSTKKLS